MGQSSLEFTHGVSQQKRIWYIPNRVSINRGHVLGKPTHVRDMHMDASNVLNTQNLATGPNARHVDMGPSSESVRWSPENDRLAVWRGISAHQAVSYATEASLDSGSCFAVSLVLALIDDSPAARSTTPNLFWDPGVRSKYLEAQFDPLCGKSAQRY